MNNADFLELSLKRAQSSGKKKWENSITASYYLVLINARGGLTSPVRVYSVKVPKSKYSQKKQLPFITGLSFENKILTRLIVFLIVAVTLYLTTHGED